MLKSQVNIFCTVRLRRQLVKIGHGAKVHFGEQHLSGALRSLHVNHQLTQLPNLAKKLEKIYSFIMDELTRTCKMVVAMETEMLEAPFLESNSQTLMSDQLKLHKPSQVIIANPLKSQIKGRKKNVGKECQNKRFKSSLEISCN